MEDVGRTVTKREEFIVEITGKCMKVFIPRKYCTVYLQNASNDYVEVSTLGSDVCIENLSGDFPCQKTLKK